MSINSVHISGNLTRDPETRQAGTTTALSFSVAVNDRVKQGNDWVDRPNFVDVTVFGEGRARFLADRLAKGVKVCVGGKLRQETWTDKQGGTRSAIRVIADEVEVLSERRQADPVAVYEPVDINF